MIFKKKNKDNDNDVTLEETKMEESATEEVATKTEEPVEEWIWVDGYKATDKNMQCRNYQYKLGELHNMPNDAKIEECESGFHLCLDLADVFKYYEIYDGNRFFKVRALVRKSHFERYGKETDEHKQYRETVRLSWFFGEKTYTKLVARSIVFERELTPDEILSSRVDIHEWSDEYTVQEY